MQSSKTRLGWETIIVVLSKDSHLCSQVIILRGERIVRRDKARQDKTRKEAAENKSEIPDKN